MDRAIEIVKFCERVSASAVQLIFLCIAFVGGFYGLCYVLASLLDAGKHSDAIILGARISEWIH